MPRGIAVLLWTVLGTLVGCLPTAVVILAVALDEGADAQSAMLVPISLIMFAPLGMVAGLGFGIKSGAKQGFATAASPCAGFVAGYIVIAISLATSAWWWPLFLSPVVGLALGVFHTIRTWR